MLSLLILKIIMIVMPLNLLPVLLCAHDRMDVVSNTIKARIFKLCSGRTKRLEVGEEHIFHTVTSPAGHHVNSKQDRTRPLCCLCKIQPTRLLQQKSSPNQSRCHFFPSLIFSV